MDANKYGPIMKKHNKDELLARVSLVQVIESCGVELRAKGREFEACCPFHTENTPSFTVTPDEDKYYCFGCGAGGDQLTFLQQIYNLDFPAALDKLADLGGSTLDQAERAPAIKRASAPSQWAPGPAPDNEPAPSELAFKVDEEWKRYPVVAAWPYRDRAGQLFAYACRVEPEPGKKDVVPVTWQTNTATGESRFKQGALQVPRLLYGAELLDANPRANIILVEGEKAADAGRRLLAGKPVIVVTWPGGSKAVSRADWSMLEGRKVVGWPDCDSQKNADTGDYLPYTAQAGMAAMLGIAAIIGESMRVVAVPQPGKLAAGWDLADAEAEGWTGKRVLEYLKANIKTAAEIAEPIPEDIPEDYLPPIPTEYDEEAGHYDQTDEERNEPFRILGWDRGEAYYLPKDSRQVASLSAGAHTRLNLLSLAPLWYWEQQFKAIKRSGPDSVDWTMAADSMMQRSKRAGIFDIDTIRGRGAWWDDGRPAVHLGDRVIIDGRAYPVTDAPSKFVYEAAKPTRIATGGALGNADAFKFVQICEALRWERPVYGKLLAGWVFLAPICGAMPWRPHIWVTGEAGTGKSTVMSEVISRALQRNMLFVMGDTSEAGLRQELGSDALPVVFDEFESERKKAAMRVEDVMALVTQSSSDTGAKLLKGGQGGKATSYQIRSMFAFSSIAVAIKQHAARTRITVLSLRPAVAETAAGVVEYQKLIETINTTLTPDYIDSMQARAVAMIPTIRHNAQVFAEAGAAVLKTRRLGDQIGALLAGAYALHSTQEITHAEARKWLEGQDWTEQTRENEQTDKGDCLDLITSHVLRVQDRRDHNVERTVGELIGAMLPTPVDCDMYAKDAEGALGRCGIRVDGDKLVIANAHKYIERILLDSPYEASYSRTLLRLDGATRSDSVKYFAGTRKRAIEIPLAHILD